MFNNNKATPDAGGGGGQPPFADAASAAAAAASQPTDSSPFAALRGLGDLHNLPKVEDMFPPLPASAPSPVLPPPPALPPKSGSGLAHQPQLQQPMPPPPARNGQPLFRPLPPQPQPQLAVGVDETAEDDGRGTTVPEFVSIGGGPAGTNAVPCNNITKWGGAAGGLGGNAGFSSHGSVASTEAGAAATEAGANAGEGTSSRKKVKAKRPAKRTNHSTAKRRAERNGNKQSDAYKAFQNAGGVMSMPDWKCSDNYLGPISYKRALIERLKRGWTVTEALEGVTVAPTGRRTMDSDEAKDVYEREIKPHFGNTEASDPPMSENPLPPTNQAASAGLPRSRTNMEETCASYAGAARSRTSTQDSVITFGSAAPATPRSTYLHSPAISNYDLSPAVSAALSATSKASARKRQRNREATECDDHMLRRIRKRNEDQAKVENEFEKMAFKARLKRDEEEDEFNKEGLGVLNDALKFQLNLSGEEEFA